MYSIDSPLIDIKVVALMRCLLAFLLAAGSAIVIKAAEVPCFAPDGVTVAPNDSFVPCNKLGITQQGIHSSCCLLDSDASGAGGRDLCAASGLCINGGIVRREYCTDPTWTSPACVKVCIDAQWGGSTNGTTELTPCTDGTSTFCCGHNNLTCCGTKWAFTVPVQQSVVGSNSTNTTTTIFETVTAPPAPATVAAIAGGLGGSLGIAILIAIGLAVMLFRERRRRHESAQRYPPSEPTLNNQGPTNGPPQLGDFRRTSFIPSGAPTVVAPSTHVSVQEFAAFKAMYEAALQQQGQQGQQGYGLTPEMGNHRLSELDANTAAAVAVAASHLQYGHGSLAAGYNNGVAFEQIREVPMEEEAHSRGWKDEDVAGGTRNVQADSR